jgi:hypothetical protein
VNRVGERRAADGQIARARRRLAALEESWTANNVTKVVVESDPAGAANLMREAVAKGGFDVTLEEHDGCWQVRVHTDEAAAPVLAEVLDLVARCLERGLMGYARLGVGQRSYTVYASGLAPASPDHPKQAA